MFPSLEFASVCVHYFAFWHIPSSLLRSVLSTLYPHSINMNIQFVTQELEYDQAKARNDNKLAEEIAEALFLLQKNNCENLANMINDYRPAAFSKVWGNDADYNEMLKTFAVGVEEGGAGASGLPPKLSKAKKSGKRHA